MLNNLLRNITSRLPVLVGTLYLGLVLTSLPALAQDMKELPPQPDALLVQQYITQYEVSGSAFPVFGVFELGHRPSCVIHLPSSRGGVFTLKVHGRVYQNAVQAPFFIWFAFEGDDGSIIKESPQFTFTPPETSNQPTWFKDTQSTSGFYGDQSLMIDVPKGTEAVWILGQNDTLSTFPNQLLGYVSHFQFKADSAVRVDRPAASNKPAASSKRPIRRRR